MFKPLFTLSFITVLFLVFGIIAKPKLAHAADSSGDIVVQTIPGPSVAQKLTARTKSSWSWYVVRGSGMIAAISLVILMISGMGLITGYTFRFLEPLTAWASHRALGIVFGVSALMHIVGLLFDHFVPFSIMQLLVPWLSHYKPLTLLGVHLGSLYVAFGVLAFYGALLVVVTSLVWVEKKPALWKLIHLLSYLIIGFVFVHALYLGTDLAHGFLRWLWIGFAVAIVIAIINRVWRANTV
ncbi:MAG: hypothetical protein WCJ24_03555 [Candidatus Saccharibacteria bacterium]